MSKLYTKYEEIIKWIQVKLHHFFEGKIMELICSGWPVFLASSGAMWESFIHQPLVFALVAYLALSLWRQKYLYNLRNKRQKLAIDLQSLYKRYEKDVSINPSNVINVESPFYKEALKLLEKSGCISNGDLWFFREGQIPPPIINHFHPNHIRGFLLKDFITQAMTYTR